MGYEKVVGIVESDEVLRKQSPKGAPPFGRDEYFISFLGKPSATAPWMIQFGGHHLALNLTIAGDVRAGDEALGILSFFGKAIVRMVPIAFGVSVIFGAVLLALSYVELIKNAAVDPGYGAFKLVCLGACLPLASYAFFAFYHLSLDLLWAVLAVPRKLDEILNNNRKS
jgi:hypothetical protein